MHSEREDMVGWGERCGGEGGVWERGICPWVRWVKWGGGGDGGGWVGWSGQEEGWGGGVERAGFVK